MNGLMDITEATVVSEEEIAGIHEMTPANLATQKQISFIKDLASARGQTEMVEETLTTKMVTKQMASKMIDDLKKLPKLKSPDGVVEPGFYLMGDTVYKVRWNMSKTNMYAVVLTKLANPDGHKKAKWDYAAGMMAKLKSHMKLTVEQAAALGHENGYCMICGIELTNPESVARGIGPVCIKKI